MKPSKKLDNYSDNALLKDLQGKYSAMRKKTAKMHGFINEFTNRWPDSDAQMLFKDIDRIIAVNPLTSSIKDAVVTGDGFSSMFYAERIPARITKPDKGYLKRLKQLSMPTILVRNLVRIDLGFQSNEYNNSGLEEAGLKMPTEKFPFLRQAAGGLCYCSLIARVVGKNFGDADPKTGKRKFLGPKAWKLSIVPNDHLSALVGKIDGDSRSFENFPQAWKDIRMKDVQKAVDRGARRSAPKPTVNKSPRPTKAQAASTEAYGHYKVVELRHMCKSADLKVTGKKAELIQRLQQAGKL